MTALTYTEKFNYYLSVFLKEMTTIFPEYQENINTHYGELLNSESESSNSEKYVKDYMTVIKPYHSQIATKDDKIFKGVDSINLLQSIDFREVWTKDINDNTRENIWKYLQTLIVIGKKVVGDDNEIDSLLEKFKTDAVENSKESSDNGEDEMLSMLKNMSTLTQDPEESLPDTSENEMKNLFEGGIISDIAKELTTELDLENLDMGEPKNMNEAFANLMGGGGGGGQNNFFNLITKVGEKIQNKVQNGEVQQGDLMKEAQKMMGGLKNPEKIANIMKNKQQQQGGATRDRLKKKLEQRQQDKEQ
jgi:hypothetical protein